MSESSTPKATDQGRADNAADTEAADSQLNDTVATKDRPASTTPVERPTEYGGQKGLEPTRYGDWEKNGRCTDF